MSVMDYLTTARDHGIPVPQFYRRPLDGSDPFAVTVHYWQCETESDLQPLAYEDYGKVTFPMTDCFGCYDQARQTVNGAEMTRAVVALTNLATFSRMQTMLEARLADLPTTSSTPDTTWCGFLDDYIMHRHRFLPRADKDGRSLAGTDEPLAHGHPLSDFARELYEDLGRQAVRLTGSNPVGQFLRSRSTSPSRPRMRAVRTTVTGIPTDIDVRACEDAALISESRTLREGPDGWRIIEWDASLAQFQASESDAELDDPTDVELDQALEVYRHSHTSTTFADVLFAVRSAYAA